MEPGKRVFINIIAQYTRAIFNTLVSLYTVRLILKIMGQSDYGIMSIILGIVGFLGFITNAMIMTTLRHLSYDYGRKDEKAVRTTFSNCFVLHLVIGLALMTIMLLLEPIIVSPHFLNIAPDRWNATHFIYKVVVIILLITFTTAPFKALLISRENIVFISVVEICDGILKLGLVFLLPHLDFDKLEAYSLLLLIIMLFEMVVFTTFDIAKYQECSPRHFVKDLSMSQLKRLSGFAGWTTYGTGAIVFRNQGIAWLLNFFYGTIVNAAYGVANQIFSAIVTIATAVNNAMNPQIIKAEGNGDRQHMLFMAETECKVIVCTMSLFFIPIIVEMKSILRLWLVEVPPYTAMFATILLASFVADQFTTGLNAANQAMGRIRTYSLMAYTPKIALVGISWLLLSNGYGPKAVMICFFLTEAGVAIIRLPYMHFTAGLSIRHYLRYVFVKCFTLILFLVVVSLFFKQTSSSDYRVFYTLPADCLCGFAFAWFLILNKDERGRILNIIRRK